MLICDMNLNINLILSKPGALEDTTYSDVWMENSWNFWKFNNEHCRVLFVKDTKEYHFQKKKMKYHVNRVLHKWQLMLFWTHYFSDGNWFDPYNCGYKNPPAFCSAEQTKLWSIPRQKTGKRAGTVNKVLTHQLCRPKFRFPEDNWKPSLSGSFLPSQYARSRDKIRKGSSLARQPLLSKP